MSRKKLIIFPFNGNGMEALDCIREEEYDFIGFVDDNQEKIKAATPEFPVYDRHFLEEQQDALVLAVPGSPLSYQQRDAVIASLNLPESRFATIIHPGAHIGRKVQLGYNCLIMAGVVLTSNVKLGNHICLLPNTVVHHDAIIGDYTLIGANVAIAGGTTIEKRCYIGSGSNIINGIKIEEGCLVGLGSNVIRSFPSGSRIAGNPARALIKNDSADE